MAERDSLTLAELDGRLREVEAMQTLIIRLLSTRRPLDDVLEHFGATDTQGRAVYGLLDDLTARMNRREHERPTFGYFRVQIGTILPSLRGDREFISLLIDTLRVERPAYRELHAYMAAQGWPDWDN